MNWFWIIASFIVLSFGLGAFLGAPWVPAFRQDLDELLDLARVGKGTKFVDLGCGDGKVLLVAAKRGANVTGFEVNPILWFIANLRLLPYRKRARIYLRSFWTVDVHRFDVIYLYLIDHHMPKMRSQLTRQANPKARIISYMFAIPGLKPSKTTRNSFLYEARAFDTIEA